MPFKSTNQPNGASTLAAFGNRIGSRPLWRSMLLSTVVLIGCAHHPEKQLYHATVISYFPHRSALKPAAATDCVVEPYAYGYQGTHWRTWADEWGGDDELMPHGTPQPTADPTSESPTPAPVESPAPKPSHSK